MIVGISTYFLFFIISILGIYKQNSKERSYISNQPFDNDISILIPFRNEAHRIKPLLDSINKSSTQLRKIFFIDDHSTDNTCRLIKEHLKITNYEIVKLPDTINGKKEALNYTINHFVDSNYSLTLDADIYFSKDYFNHLTKIKKADLCILPVQMVGKNWFEKLFSYDYAVLSGINKISAGWSKPFTASGANLLVKTEAYKKFENINKHKHFLSGDDHFLLASFQRNNLSAILFSNNELTVYTSSPNNLRDFLNQRVRWLQKNNLYPTIQNIASMISNMLLQGVFYVSILLLTIKQHIIDAEILFLVKISIDFFIIKLVSNNRISVLTVTISSIIQPLYYSLILILNLFYQPKWKGRKTKVKK